MQWLDAVFKFFKKLFKTNTFKRKYKTKSSKKLINILKSKNWQVIDIRNSIEFHENHLENTINLPVWNFNFKYYKILDKTCNILIINSDFRSNLSIYKSLKQKGFKVYILYENYNNIRVNPDFDNFTKVVVY